MRQSRRKRLGGPRPTAWSLGYQGHTIESFLQALDEAGIECVADVRENPVSRKAGFSKGWLARTLEAAGMRYVHLPELGAPKALRQGLATGETMTEFLAAC